MNLQHCLQTCVQMQITKINEVIIIFVCKEMELSHMDEFIDELLREERACDVILPRIQVRLPLSQYSVPYH